MDKWTSLRETYFRGLKYSLDTLIGILETILLLKKNDSF